MHIKTSNDTLRGSTYLQLNEILTDNNGKIMTPLKC